MPTVLLKSNHLQPSMQSPPCGNGNRSSIDQAVVAVNIAASA